MNIIANPDKLRGFERHLVKVENVSRRSILKGLGIAGSFVLAAPVLSRPAFAYETGAGQMPHGVVVDPRVFVAIAPDGTVTIVAHRSEMGTGVRTSLPLIVAEEMEADWNTREGAAGPWRRSQVRQPGHRRIAQHAALSDPDAPDRRLGPRHAGRRGRQALGRAGSRGEGRQSRGGPRGERTPHRLRRARRRRREGTRAGHRQPEAEGPEGLPLSRQGRDQHRRSPRHHHRHGAIWRRRPPARHEIRRHRASAGDRRQARVVRRRRCAEDFRRREGDGGQGLAVAFQIPAARRRCRDRAQHRRGDQGPRRPEDRLGRRRQRQIRLGRLPRRARGSHAQARPRRTQGRRRRELR